MRHYVKSVQEYESEAALQPAPYPNLLRPCLVSPLTGAGLARRVYEKRHGLLHNKAVLVCHKCDVPRCIEDSHHFLGSQKDNAKDALSKGRIDVHKWHAAANTPASNLKKAEVLRRPASIANRLAALRSEEGRATNSAAQKARYGN